MNVVLTYLNGYDRRTLWNIFVTKLCWMLIRRCVKKVSKLDDGRTNGRTDSYHGLSRKYSFSQLRTYTEIATNKFRWRKRYRFSFSLSVDWLVCNPTYTLRSFSNFLKKQGANVDFKSAHVHYFLRSQAPSPVDKKMKQKTIKHIKY